RVQLVMWCLHTPRVVAYATVPRCDRTISPRSVSSNASPHPARVDCCLRRHEPKRYCRLMDDFAYAPIACSIFTAVSRMRGANISRSSEGTLPIESVRTFPSESVSGGIHQCQVGGLSGSEVESRRFP